MKNILVYMRQIWEEVRMVKISGVSICGKTSVVCQYPLSRVLFLKL